MIHARLYDLPFQEILAYHSLTNLHFFTTQLQSSHPAGITAPYLQRLTLDCFRKSKLLSCISPFSNLQELSLNTVVFSCGSALGSQSNIPHVQLKVLSVRSDDPSETYPMTLDFLVRVAGQRAKMTRLPWVVDHAARFYQDSEVIASIVDALPHLRQLALEGAYKISVVPNTLSLTTMIYDINKPVALPNYDHLASEKQILSFGDLDLERHMRSYLPNLDHFYLTFWPVCLGKGSVPLMINFLTSIACQAFTHNSTAP
ncbi:hypothetical protein BJ165DRAFT_281077 [Panaeolus papilionaceus]|nr:hypothetical protein BJ165DRAFT_281077 [Panaeolus papilionaceus]